MLLEQYGETVVPPRTGKPGRPASPYKTWPEGTAYATVNKTYERGAVATVRRQLVHGTETALSRALEKSTRSSTINTSFVERQNGTDRTYNARKARKTYEFSKDIVVHLAVTWWVLVCYNFHHLHRGLQKISDGKVLHRTPAIAAALCDRPLSVADIITTQLPGFLPPTGGRVVLGDFGYRTRNGSRAP